MAFFLSNFIETQLMSTGAFEIFVNDIKVWSKLESGRLPSVPELVQIIESNLGTKQQFNYDSTFDI